MTTTFTVSKGDFALGCYAADADHSPADDAKMAARRAAAAAGEEVTEQMERRIATLTGDDLYVIGEDITVIVEASPLDDLAMMRAASDGARRAYEDAVIAALDLGHTRRAVAKAIGAAVGTVQNIERQRR